MTTAEYKSAPVFDIQTLSVHDGPGIRTTVFLKGCPLRCIWCHNPESWSEQPQLSYDAEKCIGCGNCVAVCPAGCHAVSEDSMHVFDRVSCTVCGLCTRECCGEALKVCGKTMTTRKVLDTVLRDKPFFENSGGGMTIAGGEPLTHFEFTRELLRMAREAGLHTAIETCGFAPEAHVRELLKYTNLFLWDLKAVDPEKHRRFTGQDNAIILQNLQIIDEANGAYRLRCPLISGLNDSPEDLTAISDLANRLKHPLGIDIEPYHPLGVGKKKRFGMPPGFEAQFTEKAVWEKWLAFLSAKTNVPVRKQ